MPAEQSEEKAEAILLRDHFGQRVLLAEDDPVNREVAQLLLRDVGLKTDLASNGAQALLMAEENDYALILMDMQMPELDGLEATSAIRKLVGRRTVPILAMTANVFAEDRAKCLAAGMNDFIPKPIDPGMLFATMVRWLPTSSRRSVAPPITKVLPALGGQDMSERQLQLTRIPGLNVEHGLMLVRDRATEYERMLALFVSSHARDVTLLSEVLASNDLAALKVLAHTLKGSAGNVGAAWVSEAADLLYSAIDQNADPAEIEGCGTALIAELTQLIERIQSVLTDPSSDSSAAMP